MREAAGARGEAMSCSPDLRCNVGNLYHPFTEGYPVGCILCGYQASGCKTTACGQSWPPGTVYGEPTKDWVGHGTKIWLLQHGGDPHPKINESLILAKDGFRGEPGFTGAGHFTLRDYGGHWALERFLPAQTIPFVLSNAMARKVDEAVRWFFDTDAMLDDPVPYRRWGSAVPGISKEEIAERLDGYQFFIDKETNRSWNQEKFLVLPPLRELPEEQKRRLVQWFDRLHFDFLDLHPDWRWTPMMGFYKVGEEVFRLV